MFVASVAMQSASMATMSTTGLLKCVSTSTGSQIGRAVNDGRGRRDRDADERIQRHRQRQAERLADDLVALRFGVAREIGNVQRERRPKTDHARERGKEISPELSGLAAGPRQMRRLRQDRPETARLAVRPPQQQQVRAR